MEKQEGQQWWWKRALWSEAAVVCGGLAGGSGVWFAFFLQLCIVNCIVHSNQMVQKTIEGRYEQTKESNIKNKK